ncbi:VWA domain-containing protein [Haloferula sargassicola]|uniref:VWFA domain-containing protein n=1 Tax=Haloferula sargassicola TaxID=490096 RepID=A0ABP9UHE7_9BACT
MNDPMLHFAHPLWLAVGAVLGVLSVLGFLKADRRRRADLDKLAHPRFHDRLVAGWSPALRWTRRGLWLAAVMLLAAAAARPQLGYEWREVKRRGIDILFAVDTSRSMLAEDLTPNRLERARLGILDFLDQLQGDRVGLVPFAGTAFALCPLTLDYDAFRESLNSLNTDLIPQQGTDLASAIREAERLFDAEENNHRLLVLITDGEDLEGEALDAAKKAAESGTTIYTVGVGAADGQTIPVRDRFGNTELLRDEAGEVVRTKLDAKTLEEIASATGGLYVPLGRGAEGLDAIYQQRLALVPKSELAQKLEKVPLERFQWPLGIALGLLMLQAVMGERRFEGKRASLASVARRVRPAATGVLVFLAGSRLFGAEAVTNYNDGTNDYASGEFESAAEKLKSSLETSDLELQEKAYYNLGNSHYRMGQAESEADKKIEQWEKSVKAFDDSLSLNPQDEDAKFNRDFVQRKLEELKQQQQQKQPQDQQDQQKQDDQQDQQKQDDQQDQQKQDGQQDEQKSGGGKDSESDEQKSDQQQGEDSSQESGDKQKQTPGQEGKSAEEGGNPDDRLKGQEEQKPKEAGEPQGEMGEAKASKGEQGDGQAAAAARKPGEMSRDEAVRLLQSLGNDERVVIPVPLSEENRERLKGRTGNRKTW